MNLFAFLATIAAIPLIIVLLWMILALFYYDPVTATITTAAFITLVAVLVRFVGRRQARQKVMQ